MPHLFRSQSRISIYAPVVLSRCVYASQNFSCAITILVIIPLGYAATSVRGFCSGARMIDTMVPAFQQPPALCNTSLCQSKLRHGIFCVLGTVYEKIFCLSTTFPSIHGCYKKREQFYTCSPSPVAAGVIFLTLFSSFGLSSQTCVPQVRHFKRKSIPARMTSKVFPPQGCCFFNSKMSPTFIFNAISASFGIP